MLSNLWKCAYKYCGNTFIPQHQIEKTLQISSSTLLNIIKRFRETGEISVHKGQDRRALLDARGLQALRQHCITLRHDSVIDITKWAQEYFQKPLSVNTICRAIYRCQLNLFHAIRKPYVNMVWKRRRVLWAKADLKQTVSKWKVFYGQTSPHFISFHFIYKALYNCTCRPKCYTIKKHSLKSKI